MGVVGGAIQGIDQPGVMGVVFLLPSFFSPEVMGRETFLKEGHDLFLTGLVHFGYQVKVVLGFELNVDGPPIELFLDLPGYFGGLDGGL
jgi:hypothetical protein